MCRALLPHRLRNAGRRPIALAVNHRGCRRYSGHAVDGSRVGSAWPQARAGVPCRMFRHFADHHVPYDGAGILPAGAFGRDHPGLPGGCGQCGRGGGDCRTVSWRRAPQRPGSGRDAGDRHFRRRHAVYCPASDESNRVAVGSGHHDCCRGAVRLTCPDGAFRDIAQRQRRCSSRPALTSA